MEIYDIKIIIILFLIIIMYLLIYKSNKKIESFSDCGSAPITNCLPNKLNTLSTTMCACPYITSTISCTTSGVCTASFNYNLSSTPNIVSILDTSNNTYIAKDDFAINNPLIPPSVTKLSNNTYTFSLPLPLLKLKPNYSTTLKITFNCTLDIYGFNVFSYVGVSISSDGLITQIQSCTGNPGNCTIPNSLSLDNSCVCPDLTANVVQNTDTTFTVTFNYIFTNPTVNNIMSFSSGSFIAPIILTPAGNAYTYNFSSYYTPPGIYTFYFTGTIQQIKYIVISNPINITIGSLSRLAKNSDEQSVTNYNFIQNLYYNHQTLFIILTVITGVIVIIMIILIVYLSLRHKHIYNNLNN